MKVSELGEFGLIERLSHLIKERRPRPGPTNKNFSLLVDIGDDAAAWRCKGTEVLTTDTVVEGVDFTRETLSWRDVGWKLMASNISDVAAMGGVPLYALVTLGLPADFEVEAVDELYEGMLELAGQQGVSIVGGDMSSCPLVFATVALTGEVTGEPLLRSAAKPGDQIGITGYVGSSAGGLEVLLKHMNVDSEAHQHLAKAHRRPVPRVNEGQVLAKEGVHAAIDVSDGLVDDLSRLCKASGVSARIEVDKIPVHPLLKSAFPDRYLELALNGGEDYQLVFSASPDVVKRVLAKLTSPAAVIGMIEKGTPGEVNATSSSGTAVKIPRRGWEHYR